MAHEMEATVEVLGVMEKQLEEKVESRMHEIT